MSEDLSQKRCVPCEGGTAPLKKDDAEGFLKLLKTAWIVSDNKKLSREFKFKNFKETMKFVNNVADIANAEEHHPDMHVSYGNVRIELSTHAIRGLSGNDFILARKIEKLFEK